MRLPAYGGHVTFAARDDKQELKKHWGYVQSTLAISIHIVRCRMGCACYQFKVNIVTND